MQLFNILVALLFSSTIAQGAAIDDALTTPFNSTALQLAGDEMSVLGGCYQYDCPDKNALMDFFSADDLFPLQYRGWIRINRCDKCQITYNIGKNGGCHTFDTTCLGKLEVCADPRNMRGHWVNGKTKVKTCVKFTKSQYTCQVGWNMYLKLYTPKEVKCTW